MFSEMPIERSWEVAGLTGYVRLWRAVLDEVVDDLKGGVERTAQEQKVRTERWMRTQDFETVCDFADFDPDWVRMKLRGNRY